MPGDVKIEIEPRTTGEILDDAWRLYLAGSVAAFETGDLQLFQVVFARPDLNDLARTRAHLYINDTRAAIAATPLGS